jgi:hypothetical protein
VDRNYLIVSHRLIMSIVCWADSGIQHYSSEGKNCSLIPEHSGHFGTALKSWDALVSIELSHKQTQRNNIKDRRSEDVEFSTYIKLKLLYNTGTHPRWKGHSSTEWSLKSYSTSTVALITVVQLLPVDISRLSQTPVHKFTKRTSASNPLLGSTTQDYQLLSCRFKRPSPMFLPHSTALFLTKS